MYEEITFIQILIDLYSLFEDKNVFYVLLKAHLQKSFI